MNMLINNFRYYSTGYHSTTWLKFKEVVYEMTYDSYVTLHK